MPPHTWNLAQPRAVHTLVHAEFNAWALGNLCGAAGACAGTPHAAGARAGTPHAAPSRRCHRYRRISLEPSWAHIHQRSTRGSPGGPGQGIFREISLSWQTGDISQNIWRNVRVAQLQPILDVKVVGGSYPVRRRETFRRPPCACSDRSRPSRVFGVCIQTWEK